MKRGFTLIELLMVVGIISLLAVSVFVALNPSKRLKDAKDARRTTDVETVLTGVHQSIVDNKGTSPTAVAAMTVSAWYQLGTAASGCALTTTYCTVAQVACVNLINAADAQNLIKYIGTAMPVDPNGSPYDQTKTGYAMMVDANGIVTVRACLADNSQIQISR